MKLVYKKNDEIGIEMNEHKWWTKVLSTNVKGVIWFDEIKVWLIGIVEGNEL